MRTCCQNQRCQGCHECSASFWRLTSSLANAVGMLTSCYVVFVSYGGQHEDHVPILSKWSLIYLAGSVLPGLIQWMESYSYDGPELIENYRKYCRGESSDFDAESGVPMVLSGRSVGSPKGLWPPHLQSQQYDGDPLEEEDRFDNPFRGLSSVPTSPKESDKRCSPLPGPPENSWFDLLSQCFQTAHWKKHGWHWLRGFLVSLKDLMEVSFLYFEIKLRSLNRINGAEDTIAPFDVFPDTLIIGLYVLSQFPFKFHSLYMNSGLGESEGTKEIKTYHPLNRGVFWWGMMTHSCEHFLPLALTVLQPKWVRDWPSPVFYSVLGMATVFLMMMELPFTLAFDGKKALERAGQDPKSFQLKSGCFSLFNKLGLVYKPVAVIAENVLPIMSFLRIVFPQFPFLWALGGSTLFSFAAGVASYFVEAWPAQAMLEESTADSPCWGTCKQISRDLCS